MDACLPEMAQAVVGNTLRYVGEEAVGLMHRQARRFSRFTVVVSRALAAK